VHKHALVQLAPDSVAERTAWLAGDNLASLARATKGSATASTARAYLLRLNALHQRRFRYVPQHAYIAGTANVMTEDDASRCWDLSDPAFLTYFNSTYPQTTSWTLLFLDPAILSAVTGALSRQRSVSTCLRIAAPLQLPQAASGPSFARPTDCARTCATSPWRSRAHPAPLCLPI
jgi:hypothetical protein